MAEQIEVSGTVAATPARVYMAWLDPAQHAAMTGGGAAECDPIVGGRFTAWDGYIAGTNLELVPEQRIVQAWRTTEFPADAPDSRVEVDLAPSDGGTVVTIRHFEIPDGQGEQYRKGWVDFYLSKMSKYFGVEGAEKKAKPPAKKAPAKAKAKPKAVKKTAKPKAKAAKAAKAAKKAAKPKAKPKAKKKGKKK